MYSIIVINEPTVSVLEFNVPALNSTEFYTGPTLETATPCRCSSIFYCLISACAVCQGNGYVR